MKGEVETEIKVNGKVTFKGEAVRNFAMVNSTGVLAWFRHENAEQIEVRPVRFDEYLKAYWIPF